MKTVENSGNNFPDKNNNTLKKSSINDISNFKIGHWDDINKNYCINSMVKDENNNNNFSFNNMYNQYGFNETNNSQHLQHFQHFPSQVQTNHNNMFSNHYHSEEHHNEIAKQNLNQQFANLRLKEYEKTIKTIRVVNKNEV